MSLPFHYPVLQANTSQAHIFLDWICFKLDDFNVDQPVRKSSRANKNSRISDHSHNNANMRTDQLEVSDTSSSGTSSDDETSSVASNESKSQSSATQLATTATSNTEEVINVRPNIQKPDFKFPTSSISSKLPSFLAQMAAANKELEDQVAAGKKVGIEVGDEETEGQHIEMNLGLGVLEERKDGDSSSEDESEGEEENVMQKLKGEKNDKGKDVGIQEL